MKMTHRQLIIITVFASVMAALGLPAPAEAAVVVLKNGQIFENVTIISDGDPLHFEDDKRSYFIGRDMVEAVIQTEKEPPPKIAVPKWAKTHLSSLPEKIKPFAVRHFDIILIAACAIVFILCVILLKFFWVNIRPLHDARREKKRISSGIKHLDPEEKAVLREFAIFNQNTLELPVEDTTVSGLIQKGILQPTRQKGEYSISGLVLPVTINPLARKRLTPAALNLPADWQNNEIQKREIIRTRPRFIHDKEQFIHALERKRPGE